MRAFGQIEGDVIDPDDDPVQPGDMIEFDQHRV
jgi:hypothetical protein